MLWPEHSADTTQSTRRKRKGLIITRFILQLVMFSVKSFHALCVGRKFARHQCPNKESSSDQLALVAFLDCISVDHAV